MSQPRLYLDRNLHIVFSVTLMSVLGVASITPVFPQVVRELGVSGLQVGLLITFFTLPGMVLPPFLGVLADRFGRKRVLVPCLLLFAVGGAACAFVRDFNALLALRLVQGMGGAGLPSMNATIIGDLYSGTRRAEAMGLNGAVLSVGTAAWPAIGGALALFGWYYPFALPLLAIPVGILALTVLKNPEPESGETMKEYLSGAWRCLRDIRILALFGAGVLAFIIIFGAYLTYFSLYMGEKFGASSFIIGLFMGAGSFTTALVSSQLGRINRWLPLGTIIAVAFVVYAVSTALVPLMPSIWLLLVPGLVFGVAQGANLPSMQTAVAALAPLEYRGAFMSINSTVLRTGQTAGPPLMGLVYAFAGLDYTFYAAAGLALLVPAVLLAYGGITRARRRASA